MGNKSYGIVVKSSVHWAIYEVTNVRFSPEGKWFAYPVKKEAGSYIAFRRFDGVTDSLATAANSVFRLVNTCRQREEEAIISTLAQVTAELPKSSEDQTVLLSTLEEDSRFELAEDVQGLEQGNHYTLYLPSEVMPGFYTVTDKHGDTYELPPNAKVIQE